jgi:ribosome recycling factor
MSTGVEKRYKGQPWLDHGETRCRQDEILDPGRGGGHGRARFSIICKVLTTMAQTTFDISDLKRRMQGAVQSFRGDLASLRTGRASANVLDPIQVEAYGARTPLNQLATVSVPEARLLSVQVWDRSMVQAVEKAIRESDLGLNPQTEGQVLRIRIPELNEQRRKEMVKVAHKYAEESKIAVRHVRRDGLDLVKKLEKDGHLTKDDVTRESDQVQKVTDQHIAEIDQALAAKEKEILHV